MIAVTGATGYMGSFLLPRLVARDEAVRCLVRPGTDAAALVRIGAEIARGDLEEPAAVAAALRDARVVLHLAHIRYAPAVLAGVGAGVERLVLVSSLRRFSRVADASVAAVTAGEDAVLASALPWVLVRPSMIYGPGDDRNISRLAARLRRRGTLPIPGSGRHLHQPVHVDDVVAGLLAAAEVQGIEGCSYALAGAAPLTYDELVDAVGAAIGVVPRKIHLPVWLVLWGLAIADWFGLEPGIGRSQVLRLQEEKEYSIAAAQGDLGYAPLAFAAGLARIYGE
ncbi:MAG: epimerase [Gemmatimonadetes bacterium]|nr:epimerase [Gemmatimonadota bacterium]